MTHHHSRKPILPPTATFLLAAVAIAALIAVGGCASGRADAPAPNEPSATAASAHSEEQWGVELVALRLTGANYMLDFRYKVLDPDKAAELFQRDNKPVLIHQATGATLTVANPAKTGPLRPTNPPLEGRTYFILFSNPGGVQRGDLVTVKIGDFESEMTVE